MNGLKLPMLVIWLTLLWAMLWGDFGINNLIAGAVIALLVTLIGRPTGVSGFESVPFRPWWVAVYCGYFLYLLVVSNVAVAREILRPRPQLARAIIAVPLHAGTDGVVTVVANTITLTPGTLTVDVRPGDAATGELPVLYVHVLQLDRESVLDSIFRIERLAVRAYGTREQLAAVDAAHAERAAAAGGER
ncbi:MAG: Na+/H+ antiporter subunit E [Actinomycetota bacterium]